MLMLMGMTMVRGEKRLGVLYATGGGFCNQHYGHLDAIAIALYANASFVVNSVADFHTRQPGPLGPGSAWRSVPLSDAYDTVHLTESLKRLGVEYLMQREPPGDSCTVDLPLEDTPESFCKGPERLDADLRAALNQANGPPCEGKSKILLRLACARCMLHPRRIWSITHALSSLRFSPRLRSLAQNGIAALRALAPRFNGVHLRLEEDMEAHFWGSIRGLAGRLYARAAEEAGLNASTPLYIATGALPKDSTRFSLPDFTAAFSSRSIGKEDIFPASVLRDLPADLVAILEFLVLLEADLLVGHPLSTFSLALQGYRRLRHMPTQMLHPDLLLKILSRGNNGFLAHEVQYCYDI